ncbi:MAG: four helix bundle protein [Candidatus Blackburnbacteria bacterium]|nr:four helix bundle protein [Candidatus Blackburnbacteria bacterium]
MSFQFQRLKVWEKAVELADLLISIADNLPQTYQFSFGEQLRRCALSVPSNIAEGSGRKTARDSGNFYTISRGSVYEAMNILVILSKRRLLKIDKSRRQKIYELAEEVCKMLTGLIKK